MDGRLHRLLISYLPASVNDFLWVVFFLGAYVTAGTKGLEVLHYTLGYSMSALIIIRIFFGRVDKGYTNKIERFQDPVAFISDLRARLKLELYTDSGLPLALPIVTALGLTISATGWSSLHQSFGHWITHVHEILSIVMLSIFSLHILLMSSKFNLHSDLLFKAMVNRKSLIKKNAIQRSKPRLVLLLLVLFISFWTYQYIYAAEGGIDGIEGSVHGQEHIEDLSQ